MVMSEVTNMVRQVVTCLVMVVATITAVARPPLTTAIFHPAFASLQVYAGESPLNDAVITLDGDDRITVEFDEIAEDVRYMRYSITHCNADWQPSQLIATEYLTGFNEGTIDNFDFSRATTVHYVHYRLSLPNEDIALTVSGNYILRVYDENDPDNTLLQARFMVTEQSVGIGTFVSSHTDVDYNNSHQQLQLEIDPSQLNVHDPFNDFKIVISQNDRIDNQRTLLHPLKLQGKKLIYEHQPELIFGAGNEYRRFETVSTTIPGMNIDHVEWHDPCYHAFVSIDEPRYEQPYLYDRTQHGGYVIREYNAVHPDTEADYLLTHFTLVMPELAGTDVYLDGDLTNRRFDGRSRLAYDADLHAYTATLLLKQGSYNYQYLVKPHGEIEAHAGPVEGDFYNTINAYRIAVYHRLPGQRYDRLVGYVTTLSQP